MVSFGQDKQVWLLANGSCLVEPLKIKLHLLGVRGRNTGRTVWDSSKVLCRIDCPNQNVFCPASLREPHQEIASA